MSITTRSFATPMRIRAGRKNTVVRPPTYQLGRTAAELLMKLIDGEEIRRDPALPVELVIRESVKMCLN